MPFKRSKDSVLARSSILTASLVWVDVFTPSDGVADVISSLSKTFDASVAETETVDSLESSEEIVDDAVLSGETIDVIKPSEEIVGDTVPSGK